MAVRFDANNDIIRRRVSDGHTLIDWNSPYTLSAWVFLVSDRATNTILFSMDNATTNYDIVVLMNGTQLGLERNLGGTTASGSGTTLSVGAWRYITLVRTSVTQMLCYLDGVLDITLNHTTVAARPAQAIQSMGNGLVNTLWSSVRIEHGRVWSAALSQAEIQEEMQYALPQRTANLYGAYPHVSDATRLNDISGNGNHWLSGGTISDEAGISPALPDEPSAGSDITPDETLFGFAAEEPALTQAHALTVDEALFALAAEEPGLTQANVIAPDDSALGVAAEAPDISAEGPLSPEDAVLALLAEVSSLTQAHEIVPDDALIGHEAESPFIGDVVAVAPEDALFALSADAPALDVVYPAFEGWTGMCDSRGSVGVWDPCTPDNPPGSLGVLRVDADGDWVLDDDLLAAAEGIFVWDEDGDLAIDDALLSGALTARIDDDFDLIAYSSDGAD